MKEGETGTFFLEPTGASLKEALKRFEGQTWNQELLRTQAHRFSRERFEKEIFASLDAL